IRFERAVDLRYEGQEHTVKMNIDNSSWDDEFIKELVQKFHEMHEFTYSFKLEDTGVEIVNLNLSAIGEIEKPEIETLKQTEATLDDAVKEKRNIYFKDLGWVETDVYDRELLNHGHTVAGPAVIEEKTTSTLILNNQEA